MNRREIDKLLADLNVPFAAVAHIETGRIQTYGDRTRVRADDLFNASFRDAARAREVYESFEGRLSPHSLGQGDVAVVLCRPKPGVLVGLFGEVSLGPLEYYEWATKLSDAVDHFWRRGVYSSSSTQSSPAPPAATATTPTSDLASVSGLDPRPPDPGCGRSRGPSSVLVKYRPPENRPKNRSASSPARSRDMISEL